VGAAVPSKCKRVFSVEGLVAPHMIVGRLSFFLLARSLTVAVLWKIAAGNKPNVATSVVIMMGRSLNTGPSTAASAMACPRARSWLTYSSMITPVCTHTPNSARNPTPEDTLKWVPVSHSASKPPSGAMDQRRPRAGGWS